jgi:hypothetical protein
MHLPERRFAVRFISTRTHGVIDYATGLLLILAPYILGFADGTAAQWVPQIIGIAVLGQALMTKFELGAVGLIPMPVHLMLDIGAGLFLAVSPWLFGFANRVFWPHLIVGLMEVALGLMTRTEQDTTGGAAGMTTR